MTEITGTARRRGVAVAVFPGGALSEITLSPAALDLGTQALAGDILDAVREATAQANQRARHALRASLAGLGERELAVLGLHQDDVLTERVEATTPQTWRTA